MTAITSRIIRRRQIASLFGLTTLALARRSSGNRSSKATNINAANSSLHRRGAEGPDVESSKIIDLEKFVPRGELDPVYFDRPYYLYPNGPIAVETLRVIGEAHKRRKKA
jgi:hypothetical protein